MLQSVEKILDALDIETFLVCESEEHGRNLMLNLLRSMGFTDVDIVFIEYISIGVRVRGRAYIHRPADKYRWILTQKEMIKDEHCDAGTA